MVQNIVTEIFGGRFILTDSSKVSNKFDKMLIICRFWIQIRSHKIQDKVNTKLPSKFSVTSR